MSKRRKSGHRPARPRSSATRTLLGVLALPVGVLALLVGVYFAGDLRHASSESADHHHEPPHQGLVVPVGEGNLHYHLELVRERGNFLVLYTLGEDAQRVVAVDRQLPQARVTAATGAAAAAAVGLEFLPFPQEGDQVRKTSRFLAKLPGNLQRLPLTVAISAIAFGEVRLPAEFRLPANLAGVDGGFAQDLFFTAAGSYTDADIIANRRLTAEQRFPGFQPRHRLELQAGDRFCPVTGIKANPECSWVVAGQTYEFCCPPCIEQFVKVAKEQPARVQRPAAYVQRQ